MDWPPSNPDNPAKRRCPNERASDTLFMSQSPIPGIKNEYSSIKDTLDAASDDDSDDGEFDDPVYEESEESLPDYPVFKPAIQDLTAKAEMAVEKLHDVLKQ